MKKAASSRLLISGLLSLCLGSGLVGCGRNAPNLDSLRSKSEAPIGRSDPSQPVDVIPPVPASVAPAISLPMAAAKPNSGILADSSSFDQSVVQAATLSTANPASKPQLVKNADLSLVVDSISTTLPKISTLLTQQQGDLLTFQGTSTDPNTENPDPKEAPNYASADLQLRVPQSRLDPMLDALTKLGRVSTLSITAEDVSNQLFDLKTRLRNLRKSEESVLAILSRSGNVSQVLEVTKELNNIRSQIEQLDAQATNLQNQVSYSRIQLHLETRSPALAGIPLGEELGAQWQAATHSVGSFSTGLLVVCLWWLAYSPFFLIPALIIGLALRRRSTVRE